MPDDVTSLLVELYAQRRGLPKTEALRRLIRIGLGLDAISPWIDGRTKNSAAYKLRSLVKVKRRKKSIFPEVYSDMFNQLKRKVGASEARRLVNDHAEYHAAKKTA